MNLSQSHHISVSLLLQVMIKKKHNDVTIHFSSGLAFALNSTEVFLLLPTGADVGCVCLPTYLPACMLLAPATSNRQQTIYYTCFIFGETMPTFPPADDLIVSSPNAAYALPDYSATLVPSLSH